MTLPAPTHPRVFQSSTLFNATVDDLVTFHTNSGPPSLTPPPIIVTVQSDTRISLTSGELAFTLWFLILPIRWVARHEAGPIATSFADVMLSGPVAYWRHEHIFTAEGTQARLTDRITLQHKPGIVGLLTRLMFDGLPLRFLFFFRHQKTKSALASIVAERERNNSHA